MRRRHTLDSLASASGVSRGMLIKIEKGRTNPSLATLCRLASALGVPIPRLLDDASASPVRLVTEGEYTVLWKGEHGGEGRLLVGLDRPSLLELWDWRLGPGDSYDAEPQIAGSVAIIHVLRSKLRLHIENNSHDVKSGESITFRADIAHGYDNQTKTPVKMIIAYNERKKETDDLDTSSGS
jgi:transcriptional regulator with XRE-family HTH domain